jgi:hypothetical protein
MRKKLFILTIVCIGMTANLFSFELGLIGGKISNPSEAFFGISGGSGFLFPMVKLEVEYWKLADTDFKALSGGIKFRPRFGMVSPYAVLGVGSEFGTFDFKFSDYNNFSFLGFGVHLHFIQVASLRIDVRFLNYSGYNRTRFSGGIFLQL